MLHTSFFLVLVAFTSMGEGFPEIGFRQLFVSVPLLHFVVQLVLMPEVFSCSKEDSMNQLLLFSHCHITPWLGWDSQHNFL
jgi:hypothetical protein